MACREIAALRLALMHLLGEINEKERKHDLLELGEQGKKGPLKALSESKNFTDLFELYGHCLSELHDQYAKMDDQDQENRAYYQSLLIINRKIEMELDQQRKHMRQFLQDLQQIHHLIHEIHPTAGLADDT